VGEGGGEGVGEGVGVGVAVGAEAVSGVGVAPGVGAAAGDCGSESPHAATIPSSMTVRTTAGHTRVRMNSSGTQLRSDSEANDNTGPKTVNAVNKPAKTVKRVRLMSYNMSTFEDGTCR
jgi:hypothetical protein